MSGADRCELNAACSLPKKPLIAILCVGKPQQIGVDQLSNRRMTKPKGRNKGIGGGNRDDDG